MSNEDKSKQIADNYGMKAKEAMDKVTDDQPEEVKERVDKVQNAVDKTIGKAKDTLS
ncbi:MAG: CsbD family protein [Pleurocapsa sp.]